MKFLPTKLTTLAKEQNRFCLHADLTWMMENFSPDVYNVLKKLTSGWKQLCFFVWERVCKMTSTWND